MPQYDTVFKTLYPTVAEVVLARNVLNVDEIDEYVANLAHPGFPEPVRQWLKSNLRNYIINDLPEATPVRQLPKDSPDWAKKAMERGDPLLEVTPKKPFRDKIQHVLDFLKSDAAPARLDRLTVPEAIKQSDAWTVKLGKRKVDEKVAAEGEKVIKEYPGGFSWKELSTKDALNREGKLMGHCVGDYCYAVEQGGTAIWSLRDAKNQPHATLELHPGTETIQQIKGKENKAVVPKYHQYVKDILNDNLSGWEAPTYDLNNAGMVRFKDKIVDIADIQKELEDDPDEARGLVGHMFGMSQEKLKEDVKTIGFQGDGVWVKTWGADTLLRLLGNSNSGVKHKDIEELEGLLDEFYDVDMPMKDQDYAVNDLIEGLQDKRHKMKTYAKLMADIKRVGEETEDEFNRNYAGEWVYKHQDDLPALYEATVQGLADGWTVGSQGAAYKYVSKLLEAFRWMDGSYVTKDGDNLVMVISYGALVGEDGLGEFDTDIHGRMRNGFEYEYDEDAALERFVDTLDEQGYLVAD